MFKFIEDMPAAFARADLMVCRSGEHGRRNHGRREARDLCAVSARGGRSSASERGGAGAAGAAVVVEESKLEGVWLAETIAALLADSWRLERMSAAARELAHPNAARDIAAMAARVAGVEG